MSSLSFVELLASLAIVFAAATLSRTLVRAARRRAALLSSPFAA